MLPVAMLELDWREDRRLRVAVGGGGHAVRLRARGACGGVERARGRRRRWFIRNQLIEEVPDVVVEYERLNGI